MYREAFEDMRLKNKNLSRCLEDSGTLTSPLVPWNTCGATMSTYLNVPTVQYAPFAFLNLINPLVSIFYGFTGISMEKMTEEEYQAVLENRRLDKEAAAKAAEA
jgi:NhaC family Na+:H+ antiporter